MPARTAQIAIVALLASVAISSVRGQVPTHPDFSGTWLMDTARSEKSSFNPAGMFYRIVQTGTSLVIDRASTSASGAVTNTHMVIGTEGKPWPNPLKLVGQEVEAMSTVTWLRDTLMIRTTSTPGDKTLLQVDKWMLSADGSTLMMRREATYDGAPIGAPMWVFGRAVAVR